MDNIQTVSPTLTEARERYLGRATFKSQRTMRNYARAIDLFIDFLREPQANVDLPLLGRLAPDPTETPLGTFSAGDAPLLLYFAGWLKAKNYKDSTILLYISGLTSWLKYADNHGWLPNFSLNKAQQIVRDETRHVRTIVSERAPKPPDYIEQAIYYYDTISHPTIKNEAAAIRWELMRLRNRALMHTLAETGGRVSEVVALNLGDFPPRCFLNNKVLRVPVNGKGGYTYELRLLESLPAIRDYLKARDADTAFAPKREPLFVTHSPTPSRDGRRLTRHNAGYVVRKAARAMGLKDITPHQFRHWRASQLVNAGVPLDVVQDYLGHRSVETTRRFYASTDAERVDAATRQVGLPKKPL
jgi:integrase/recombinase XerD